MKKGVLIILAITILLAGCAQRQPNIVCSSPYMRHADGCCLDRNDNGVCDIDEDEEPFFVEPDYAPVDEIPETEWEAPEYERPAYEEPEEVGDEPEVTYVGGKDEVASVPSRYTAPEAKLVGWKAGNARMTLEVTGLVFEVREIKKVSLTAPDKEVCLKEMRLTIKNIDYLYLNPQLYFRVGDSRDPIIIKETLMCDRSDDIVMQGCYNALPEGESMDIVMEIDERLPRFDIDKEFQLTFKNRRDSDDRNVLEIKKVVDILDIPGAKYI
ncbi:hypothetical protein JW898_05725 [Candidatus Woesearchaeota archaeon]|nr:hypothetical protein [Candidatus Woesearchaeota archaeon]